MSNKYITNELAENTKYKLITNAYQKNNLSIVVINDTHWYMECCESNKVADLVLREMKRLYPQYRYLYEAFG